MAMLHLIYIKFLVDIKSDIRISSDEISALGPQSQTLLMYFQKTFNILVISVLYLLIEPSKFDSLMTPVQSTMPCALNLTLLPKSRSRWRAIRVKLRKVVVVN